MGGGGGRARAERTGGDSRRVPRKLRRSGCGVRVGEGAAGFSSDPGFLYELLALNFHP